MLLDALGALAVGIMLLACGLAKRDGTPRFRRLQALMICCLAVFAVDIPGLLLDGRAFPGARALLWLLDTAYWLAHVIYCWLWMRFALEWKTGARAERPRLTLLIAAPLLGEMAIIAANPWTGWLFTLNEHNAYTRGSAYLLCLLPYYFYVAAALIVALRGCFRGRDPQEKRRGLYLLCYMFLPICGVAMEWFAYGVSWVWPMIALSLLMIYLSMQQQALADETLSAARSAEKAARMEVEMTNSRMAIMLSQIQPHFLYNALCVIQDLCHDHAPEAERATIAFSRFLRGNLDSLNADKPIPFSQELSHTRYYLALEEMRFGERLRVAYALRTENFRLPAMTLQPIVENAVRYGVMKREAGGTVRIESGETDTDFFVAVRDDGVGFDPAQRQADGRTHIGIDNVRQRLREMCGGELTIESVRGAGTTAVITLPKGVCAHADHSG